MSPGHREALLRTDAAELYPGVTANEWKPVGQILDIVRASRLLQGRSSGDLLATRVLDDRHFEFRGMVERPSGLRRDRSRSTDM